MAVYNISGANIGRNAYSISGERLVQAYDIHGNPLFEDTPTARIETLPNQATGTDSGYSFWLSSRGYRYPLYDVVDFLSDSVSYQSFCYDEQNNVFYKFDASTTVKVYDSNFQKTGNITLPQLAGHTNDACYYDGRVYLNGGDEYSGIYEWDITLNSVSELPVNGIPSPTSAPKRINTALCNVPNEAGFLYMAYVDFQTDELTHDANDKLGIYKYNISTHDAELIADYPWDCVYSQGMEICDGVLYMACNSPTTGHPSNYTGITLKAFRVDTWSALQSLYLTGVVEPEGMCKYPYSDTSELMMGIAHYGTLAKATRFSIPYRLIQAN